LRCWWTGSGTGGRTGLWNGGSEMAGSGAAATTNTVNLSINNIRVPQSFAGLSGAGLHQINLTVPAGLGTGDVPLVATVGGVTTQSVVVISLQ